MGYKVNKKLNFYEFVIRYCLVLNDRQPKSMKIKTIILTFLAKKFYYKI